MKRFAYILFLAGCSTTTMPRPEVWVDKDQPSFRTLRMYTGEYAQSLYDKNFRDEAKNICPNGYDILETTYTPTTLHESVYSPYYYNWVIDCPLDTNFEKDQ